jgi:hypothetical protein
MTIDEIKAAVQAGKTVHWASRGYTVKQWSDGRFVIVCTLNGSAFGLTHLDGVTMNGKPSDFFVREEG